MSNDFDEPTEPSPAGAGPGLLTVLWRRKALLVFGVVVGLGLGYLDFIRRERVYQSTAQLYVQKRRVDPLMQPGLTGGLGTDSRVAFIEDYLATQEALVKSNEVLVRAAMHLENTPLEIPPLGGDAAAFIASGLTVSRVETGRGTMANILSISFRGPSSVDCEAVVNAVIDAYRDSLTQGVQTATSRDLDQIRAAKTQIDKDLEEYDLKYAAARKKSIERSPVALTDLNTRINLKEGKKDELDTRQREIDQRLKRVKEARANREDPQAILRFLQRAGDGRTEKPLDSRPLEDPTATLRLELDGLLETLGKDHPQVASLQRRIDTLSKQIPQVVTGTSPDKQIESFVIAMTEEVKIVESLSNDLEAEILLVRQTVKELAGLQIDETLLGDRRDRLRKRLTDLEDRERQIELTKEARLYDARVINPAGPGSKISPVLLQCLMLAIALGLVGGGGLAYLAELTDKSFRNPEDLRRRLGLAVVGHIPSLGAPKPHDELTGPIESRVVVHHRPKSTESEAYRGVRTALYFSTRGKGHQVIQVTSPNPGDGKSTLCANLAVAIAQSGKRVLLMDCDFRKPRVHKIFGIGSEVGLASVITGETDLVRAIQPSGVLGLSLLPCGPRPANPAELLTSQRFPEVLEEIKKSFDFVLIDTPPLLAVSDPAAVVPRVDGVLLTIRITNSVRPAAERAKETLMALGANVIGVVVNDLHGAKKGAYGYGYDYGYKYSYNYGYADHYGDSAEDSGVLLKLTDRPPTNGAGPNPDHL